MPLVEKDKALVRLFMAACAHTWALLPGANPDGFCVCVGAAVSAVPTLGKMDSFLYF